MAYIWECLGHTVDIHPDYDCEGSGILQTDKFDNMDRNTEAQWD